MEIKKCQLGGKIGGLRRRLRALGIGGTELDAVVDAVYGATKKKIVALPLKTRNSIANLVRQYGKVVVSYNGKRWNVINLEGYMNHRRAALRNFNKIRPILNPPAREATKSAVLT